jgi:putative transposase
MPNARRIHVPGGTYYLFRRTDLRHPIFSGPEDYSRFDDLLTLTLESTGVKLLGYCWMPDAIHFAIEIADGPVARFMRDLMWRYSRRQWQRADDFRPWFRERYHATLVQAEVYLETLICHIHYLPVRAALAERPDEYPYTSHHAYLGRPSGPTVYTRRLLQSFCCAADTRTAYRDVMAEAPSDSLVRILEKGMPTTRGIVGDQTFIAERCGAQQRLRVSSPLRNLDRLIMRVAEHHSVSMGELSSKSRRRALVIARAQITWFAILWDLATITDVGRRLHHSPSALSRAVTTHRRRRPELFRPDAITRPNYIPSVSLHTAAE